MNKKTREFIRGFSFTLKPVRLSADSMLLNPVFDV